MSIPESELILNPDGSIYHLNLHPQDIADTIIVVGDQNRVGQVSKHFDEIELKKENREFVTHTGWYTNKRITVISTGIGTDNIDIVCNELDALVNIDFESRSIKPNLKSLSFVRIGTSGAIQDDLPVDSFLMSEIAIGLDGLMHFYNNKRDVTDFEKAVSDHLAWKGHHVVPYAYNANKELMEKLSSNRIRLGITLTNAGFYAPQGRMLRLKIKLDDFHQKLQSFRYQNRRITNMEMETAGIYGLSHLLGHKAVSMNAILANRPAGTFSKNPSKTIEDLITYCLEKIST